MKPPARYGAIEELRAGSIETRAKSAMAHVDEDRLQLLAEQLYNAASAYQMMNLEEIPEEPSLVVAFRELEERVTENLHEAADAWAARPR